MSKLIHPKQRSWFSRKTAKRPAHAFLWNDTFGEGVLVLFGVNTEQMQAEYRKYNTDPDLKDEDLGDICLAKFLSYGGVHCISFTMSKPAPGVIAHEALHFVNAICDDRGIKFTRDNDETHAYLVQWVTDRIYNLSRTGRFGI